MPENGRLHRHFGKNFLNFESGLTLNILSLIEKSETAKTKCNDAFLESIVLSDIFSNTVKHA